MKVLLVIVSMFCIITLQIHAQERFARIYDDGSWWASLITSVVPLGDGYTAAGICVDTTNRTDCFFLWDMGNSGEVLNSKILSDTNRHVDVFKPSMEYNDAQNKFNIVGYQIDTYQQTVLFLSWPDDQWPPEERVFDDLDIEGADYQFEDYYRQGQYIFVSSSIYDFEGRPDQDNYLFKYDIDQDKIIWQQKQGSSAWREIRSVLHPIDDTTFLLGFNRNDRHRTNNHFDYRMAIWKMDTSGQKLDEFELDIPDRLPGWPTDMISTDDGGFIIVGNIHTETHPDIGLTGRDGYVFKLDENLNFVWGTEIKGDLLGGLSSASRIVKVDGEENYIVSGHLVDYNPESGAEWSESLSFLAKIDEDGDILWHQYFNFVDNISDAQEFHYNYDMRPTPDGGYILSGSYRDILSGNNGKQRGYLIKVDSDGCLIPDCGLLATDDTPDDLLGLHIYPNPTSDFLAFQIRSHTDEVWHGQIVDGSGRRIKTLSSLRRDVQHLIAVDTWSAGIYFMELRSTGGERVRGRFVVGSR